jgi:L-methionine (R)-S-oxide reductase
VRHQQRGDRAQGTADADLRRSPEGHARVAGSPIDYATIFAQAGSLLDGERDPIANAANLAALLYHELPDVNWAGFYFLRDGALVLGPFHGQPACVRIGMGQGVCGTAAERRETVVVPNVDAFPGHIACDTRSRSEIVVPVISGDVLVGVLDVDSPRTGRFTEEDRRHLERIVAAYVAASYGSLS